MDSLWIYDILICSNLYSKGFNLIVSEFRGEVLVVSYTKVGERDAFLQCEPVLFAK